MSLLALQFYLFSLLHVQKFSVTGVWSLRSDQFSFATVLTGLICKRAFSGENWKDNTEHPLLWAEPEGRTWCSWSWWSSNDKDDISLYGLLHSETSYNVADCSVVAGFTCFQWGFWCGGRFFYRSGTLILLQWRKKAQIGKDVLRRMLNKSSTELFSFLWVWLCEPDVMLPWELIWYEKTWYIVF